MIDEEKFHPRAREGLFGMVGSSCEVNGVGEMIEMICSLLVLCYLTGFI